MSQLRVQGKEAIRFADSQSIVLEAEATGFRVVRHWSVCGIGLFGVCVLRKKSLQASPGVHSFAN